MTIFSKFTKSNSNEKNIHPWSQRKLNGSNNALPRIGHGATALDNNHFLVYGGTHKGGNIKKNLFIIDTNTMTANSVTTMGDIPAARSFASIISIGSFVLLYGGQPNVPNDVWDPYFYVLHTNTRQWSRVRTKGKLPSERAGHSTCVSEDGIMYVFGGHFQRKYLNDLYAFNVKEYPSKAEWDLIMYKNQGPSPRSGHISVIYEKKLYVFGGINANHLYNDIWSFDLITYTWQQIPAVGYIPAPRESCAAALVDDTIYIFGGKGSNGNSLGDLYAFRIKSQRWYMFQGMGSPPSPRYGLSLTVIQNKIYVFGGDSINGKSDDSNYVYILDCSKIKYPLEEEVVNIKMNSPVEDTPLKQPNSRIDSILSPKHRISPADEKLNSPTTAYSIESNSSHPSKQSHESSLASLPSVPPRPSREGVMLDNDVLCQKKQLLNANMKRESSLLPPLRTGLQKHRPLTSPINRPMSVDERKTFMKEIVTRDTIINEMKKKEQWWRTEVSIARQMRQQQQQQRMNHDEEPSLIQFLDENNQLDSEKLLLFEQLVSVKTELKKIKTHLHKQSEPMMKKIEQAENVRTAALEEAAYYKAKYMALKSHDKDAFDLLELDRTSVLEKRLTEAYEVKEDMQRELQKIRSQSEYDKEARMLAEERAKDAQQQSEKAQEAHQKTLEQLTELYQKMNQLEAQSREDAAKIADLSNQLANQLALSPNEDQRIKIARLEAENIKSRNEIAMLLKKLEDYKDEEMNLKMLLNDKDQVYSEAMLEYEKTCIELELLRNLSIKRHHQNNLMDVTTVV
ncbi:uncharacterized protein BX663DRAFT_505114 [Cokeromyces recurvatus]|uniref:uncharacterized protein n=1 Tax=Cokeromyces recurvatus TaxID=90255 RepID=UPI00221EE9AC|nr:uncharacterized protein BX663DRAFT_505114 [Cokeromyces recurvatus]KAI7904461.1 hypothetical protein BX663DRAFT_505114 [Cokeromyces recurvatus]